MAASCVSLGRTGNGPNLARFFAPPSRPGPSPSLAPTLPTDTLDVNAEPARPDGAFLEDPEETPIPARIVGLRLA